jgi:hypothetical protein
MSSLSALTKSESAYQPKQHPSRDVSMYSTVLSKTASSYLGDTGVYNTPASLYQVGISSYNAENAEAWTYPFEPGTVQLVKNQGPSQTNTLTERRVADSEQQTGILLDQSEKSTKLDLTRLSGYNDLLRAPNAYTSQGSVINAPTTLEERDEIFRQQIGMFKQ